MRPGVPDSLRLYLEDHLAVALGARELASRCAEAEASGPLHGSLGAMASELEQDLDRLREFGAALGVDRMMPVKEGAAWLAEKLGRLKLNGALVERSPLSAVLELEMLDSSLQLQRHMWQTLAEFESELPPMSGNTPAGMSERVVLQQQRVGQAHEKAVQRAFGGRHAQSKKERRVDHCLEETFPASDPPSFNPGSTGRPHD